MYYQTKEWHSLEFAIRNMGHKNTILSPTAPLLKKHILRATNISFFFVMKIILCTFSLIILIFNSGKDSLCILESSPMW
jgi:hypothetical protein